MANAVMRKVVSPYHQQNGAYSVPGTLSRYTNGAKPE